MPFRQAHSRLVEKTLGDIHRESTTELARGGHPVNYLQLLIIVVPDVPGHYGECYQIVDLLTINREHIPGKCNR